MQISKRKIEKAFLKKGFGRYESAHHIRLILLKSDGTRSNVKTFMSHSSKKKDIDDYLISEMSSQLGLTKKQFIEFVDCTISQEEFESIVKDKI